MTAKPLDEDRDARVAWPELRTEGPRPSAEPTTPVVLGYRAGPYGDAVLHHGADLAVRLGAALHVVHVVDLSDYPVDPDSPDWEQQAQETLAASNARWSPRWRTSRVRGPTPPRTATRWRCCGGSPTATTP